MNHIRNLLGRIHHPRFTYIYVALLISRVGGLLTHPARVEARSDEITNRFSTFVHRQEAKRAAELNRAKQSDQSQPRAKSIILFIGDGMGPDHRRAGQWKNVGMTGALSMDDMDISGWVRTSAANCPAITRGS